MAVRQRLPWRRESLVHQVFFRMGATRRCRSKHIPGIVFDPHLERYSAIRSSDVISLLMSTGSAGSMPAPGAAGAAA